MNIKVFILFWMFFMHIVDDYYLQGCLAKFKCRDFWKENAPQDLYKHDYIVALIMHGFSWAFMVHLPVLFYNYFVRPDGTLFNVVFIMIVSQGMCHAVIDNLKANEKDINLIIDQMLHIIQIIAVWVPLVKY